MTNRTLYVVLSHFEVCISSWCFVCCTYCLCHSTVLVNINVFIIDLMSLVMCGFLIMCFNPCSHHTQTLSIYLLPLVIFTTFLNHLFRFCVRDLLYAKIDFVITARSVAFLQYLKMSNVLWNLDLLLTFLQAVFKVSTSLLTANITPLKLLSS